MACVIAWIALKHTQQLDGQGKKIDELVSITTELKVQNEILLKRYDLERILSIKSRMPFFIAINSSRGTNTSFVIQAVNNGVGAQNIRARIPEEGKNLFSVRLSHTTALTKNSFTITIDTKESNYNGSIKFDLAYNDSTSGIENSQTVFKEEGNRDFIILQPTEV